MDAIEKENASLKGVLPKVFARQNLDPTSLGELIDLVGNIALGDVKARSADVLDTFLNISWASLPLLKARKAASSIRQEVLLSCWLKCWNPTMAEFLTLAVVQGVCLFTPKNL